MPKVASSLDFYVCPDQAFLPGSRFDNYDLVHFHGARGFQNAAWTERIHRRGIPAVLQPHGSLPYIGGKRPAKILYDWAVGWRTYRAYRLIVALSAGEAADIVEFGIHPDRITVLPNGVDPESFSPLPRRGNLRAVLGIGDDSVVFTFLGRLNRLKGLDILIPAFATAARMSPGAKLHLIIAGPPSDFSSALPSLIETEGAPATTTLLGQVQGTAKNQLLVDTDWLVMPSHYEVFSLALLEAAAVGVPTILSTACRFQDFVLNDAAISVRPQHRPLAEAIKSAAENPETRNRMGAKALRHVLLNYTWDSIAEKAQRLYERAISGEEAS